MKIFLATILMAFIFTFTGMTIADVGEPYASSVYSWELPILMFFLLVVPATLGYLLGREK